MLQKARYIDESRCIACGICAEKCPKKVPNDFNQGLNSRKAAYVLYPQAVPLKYAIDKEHCIYFLKGKCRACEKFCPAEAIDFSQDGPGPESERRLGDSGSGFPDFRRPSEAGIWLRPLSQCDYGSGIRADVVGHRAHRRPYQAPLRWRRAGKNRLDTVRRVPGCRPRPALLLLGLLHVRHQAGHYCPGARCQNSAHHFLH